MRRSAHVVAWISALALPSAIDAGAQETRPNATPLARVGERVRVTTPSLSPNRRVGLYAGIRNDSLLLRNLTVRDSVPLALHDIRRFYVSQGVGKRSRRASVGWGIGGMVGGALLGMALGEVFFDNSTGCDTFDFTGCQEEAFAVFFLGLMGGVAGTTISYNLSRRPRERWRSVALERR